MNGFSADSGNKSINLVKKVKIGDWIAIKSAFVMEKTVSTVRIKAVGIVRNNLGDGRHLEVEWIHKGPAFDVIGASYMQTIHNVTDKTDQHLIFKNSFKTERKGLQVANKSLIEKVELQKASKNLIFWGPPGTGKTRELLLMQNSFKGITTTKNSGLMLTAFISKLSWWEVIAVSLIEIVIWPRFDRHEKVWYKA